jgi:hypothetical protein
MINETDLVGLRKCTDFDPEKCDLNCVHRELHQSGPYARHCDDPCEHNENSRNCKVLELALREAAISFERTGEVRCPKKGEWFMGSDGYPKQAYFDFEEQVFDILRLIKNT